MPRRPRPAHRKPPVQTPHKPEQPHLTPASSKSLGFKKDISKPKSKQSVFEQASSSSEESEDALEDAREAEDDLAEAELDDDSASESASRSSDSDSDRDASEDEPDIDAPRVAQWQGDDDMSDLEENEDARSASKPSSSRLESLQDDLVSLPLGALRKARLALRHAQPESDSESESGSEAGSDASGSDASASSVKGKEKERERPKQEWSTKPRPDLQKRANKHAPIEVTSKRPVTRRRTVVDVPVLKPRDPRFLPLAGAFSPTVFQKQYAFLADAHSAELSTLRDNLKHARKLLASSPRDLRPEREAEVERLVLAVKRAESTVDVDRRERVRAEALGRVAKAEKEKRKEGKGGWWMKEADKRELIAKARYEDIAARGGKRAVKKAIEKKQRKIGQKEKKARPFARDEQERRAIGRGVKRRDNQGAERPQKRPRMS